MHKSYYFHVHRNAGASDRMAPSGYYISEDCTPISVRIQAESAPLRNAIFDVYKDRTTIMRRYSPLPAGATSEELAENILQGISLEKGSWLSADMIDAGGGYNFSLEVEVEEL